MTLDPIIDSRWVNYIRNFYVVKERLDPFFIFSVWFSGIKYLIIIALFCKIKLSSLYVENRLEFMDYYPRWDF